MKKYKIKFRMVQQHSAMVEASSREMAVSALYETFQEGKKDKSFKDTIFEIIC